MALPETIAALFTTKAAAAAVGLSVAAGAAGFTVPAALQDDQAPEEAPTEESSLEEEVTVDEVTVEDVTTEEELGAEEDGEPSETAQRVHDALNGDEDVWPGDEGFGQAVADNARSNPDFGQDVAAAARGDEVEDEETSETEQQEVEDDEGDEGDGEGRPEHAGPPANRPGR